MDMPAIIAEYFPGISVESISEVIEDYQPAWQIIQHTWSSETLKEIMQGKVSVPDSVINEAIANRLLEDKDSRPVNDANDVIDVSDDSEVNNVNNVSDVSDGNDGNTGDDNSNSAVVKDDKADKSDEADETDKAGKSDKAGGAVKAGDDGRDVSAAKAGRAGVELPVTELRLTSKADGRLEIFANTRKMGRLEFSGTIEEFVHNKADSHVTYRVRERAMKDHGLASWFFSRISMSMAQKLFGRFDLGESLPTTVKGNYITVDCKEALEQSELAAAQIKGYRILDMLEIKNAVPHDGYIMFETRLNIPQEIQTAALDLLLRRNIHGND